MYENETLVTDTEQEKVVQEEVAENVEQTTEQTEKTYTEAEFNAKLDEVLGKKIARREAKIRKEYDRKYGGLMDVLKAGTGKEDVGEITDTFGKFYESKGIKIEKKPEYTGKDLETLARYDADEIIRGGYEDVVDEVDRLTEIGAENMTAREKAVFKALAEHRQNAEQVKELEKIGVGSDVYDSADFKEFQKMFRADVPITKVYEQYAKAQPKKQIQTMGSMKQNPANRAKEFYTQEEIERLTEEDLDDPVVWETVRRSMTGR